MGDANEDPMPIVERLLDATNAHDVEGIVACFAEGYTLESPLHPARSFRGKEQVRRNWTQILSAVDNLTARVLAATCDARTVWSEWEMIGTRRHGGGAHHMRGVLIFRIDGGLIVSGRIFLEPVDTSSADASEGLRQVLAAEEAREPRARR